MYLSHSYEFVESNFSVGFFDGYWREIQSSKRIEFDDERMRVRYFMSNEKVFKYVMENPEFILKKTESMILGLIRPDFLSFMFGFGIFDQSNIIVAPLWKKIILYTLSIILIAGYLYGIYKCRKEETFLLINIIGIVFFIMHAYILPRAPYFFISHILFLVTLVKLLQGWKLRKTSIFLFTLFVVIIAFRTPVLAKAYRMQNPNPIKSQALTVVNGSKVCVQIAGPESVIRPYEFKYIPYSRLSDEQREAFIEHYGCTHLLLRRGSIKQTYKSKKLVERTMQHKKKFNWFLFSL